MSYISDLIQGYAEQIGQQPGGFLMITNRVLCALAIQRNDQTHIRQCQATAVKRQGWKVKRYRRSADPQ